MQRILLTEQSFRKMREAGALYVDKTKQIYDLFSWDKYFFIARPRRFGKSLLCSTLAELFAGNRELFKNTWIDGSDWKWEKHPVIHLDMTSAAGSDITIEEMLKALQDMLLFQAEQLGVTLEKERPAAMLEKLIKSAAEKYGVGVALIIDEYDKPILDTIEKPEINQKIHEALQSFYGPLKKSTIYLKFVFITGVFKFTKTSIFSNFNNLNDITFDAKASAIVGYTEQDIKLFFAEHLAVLAQKANVPVDTMMLSLQAQYNGYKFGIDTLGATLSEGVYNSYALNYVFEKKELVDKWFASGTPRMLIKKLKAEHFSILKPENLQVSLNVLSNSCTPDAINGLSMLYYAGYMTMQQCETDNDGLKPITTVTLGFPNANVAYDFTQVLLPAILDKPSDKISALALKIRNILRDERLEDLCTLLNDTLNPYAYPVLSQAYDPIPAENLYQIIFAGMFIAGNMRTTMEYMSNRGRIDLTVELPQVVYIFEIKLDESAATAIAQIKETDYGAKFRHQNKKIYAVGISVSSEKRFVKELVWELL